MVQKYRGFLLLTGRDRNGRISFDWLDPFSHFAHSELSKAKHAAGAMVEAKAFIDRKLSAEAADIENGLSVSQDD